MTTQHTPGPWDVGTGRRGTLCVTSADTWICGELENNNNPVPSEEAQANARLIAAAPDLLAALSEYLVLGKGKCTIGKALADKALSAIAKATGQS